MSGIHAGLRFLQELWRLKTAVGGKAPGFDTNQLAQDFLRFSSYTQNRALTVKLPAMYELSLDQKSHLELALAQLRVHEVPAAADFSGSWEGIDDRLMFFFSVMQKEADHRYYGRASLDPLISAIYTEGFGILRDFTIREVLYGSVSARRGSLELDEAHLFPERFTRGKYELSIVLDTPHRTIDELISLYALLGEFAKNPKASLLSPKKVDEAVSKGISLRSRLGSLSRYNVPESHSFSAETDAVMLSRNSSDLFYLFAPKEGKNVFVYFGDNPFVERSPEALVALDGSMHQETLAELLQLGIFDVSTSLLASRIDALETAYEGAARGLRMPIQNSYADFSRLLIQLKDTSRYFASVVNPDARRRYCASLPTELLEFVVYPASENPVVHLLLPRLSWNPTMRQYHDTRNFMEEFDKAEIPGKKAMLENLASSMLFANQQNNDVNVWLYQNHRKFCESSGLAFELM